MKKIVIASLGFVTAILLGMLLLLVQGYNPIESYSSIIKYSMFSSFGITNTLNRMGILLLTSSSAAFALGSGVSNLGQFGQLLTGAMAATLIGVYVDLPPFILIPLILIAATVAGSLFALIAGLLKKYFSMNEFITTLMLNFIADSITQYMVSYPFLDPKSNWPMSKVINNNGVLASLGSLDPSVILSFVIFMAMVFYTQFTRDGYELKMMGSNKLFSRTGGVEIDKNFIKVMAISGALAGLAGGLMIVGSSQQNRFLPGFGRSYADDGLMVSILSGNSVPIVFLYSFVFSMLQSGATGMQLDTGVPSEFTVMLIAVTVLSVVAFRSYAETFLNKMALRKKVKSLSRKGGTVDESNNRSV